MSTDYNYDDQVRIPQPQRSMKLADIRLGPILPLLHPDHGRSYHFSLDIQPPQTEPRCVRCRTVRRDAHPPAELESNAPRIKSDFKPAENDIIQAAKTKQWRRERRLKRIIATLAGYAVMGWMVYLIVVTQRIIPKIWDPYNILDISRVGMAGHGPWAPR